MSPVTQAEVRVVEDQVMAELMMDLVERARENMGEVVSEEDVLNQYVQARRSVTLVAACGARST